MTQSHTRRLFVLLVALVSLLALGGAIVSAGARTAPDPGGDVRVTFLQPTLTGAASIFRAPGSLLVGGIDFTPGGRVEIAVYDQSGTELIAARFVTATTTVYGREWSADPSDLTVGFTRAGVISEAFETPCGSTSKVRAYDQQTARWSDWLELTPGC